MAIPYGTFLSLSFPFCKFTLFYQHFKEQLRNRLRARKMPQPRIPAQGNSGEVTARASESTTADLQHITGGCTSRASLRFSRPARAQIDRMASAAAVGRLITGRLSKAKPPACNPCNNSTPAGVGDWLSACTIAPPLSGRRRICLPHSAGFARSALSTRGYQTTIP